MIGIAAAAAAAAEEQAHWAMEYTGRPGVLQAFGHRRRPDCGASQCSLSMARWVVWVAHFDVVAVLA